MDRMVSRFLPWALADRGEGLDSLVMERRDRLANLGFFAAAAIVWVLVGLIVTTRDPVADPAATLLPKGFDLSRFGPHVQAAYRGPTRDNPSLSLKTRLKRAQFFDQRERMAASRGQPSSEPARRDDQFMFRPAEALSDVGSEPAFNTGGPSVAAGSRS